MNEKTTQIKISDIHISDRFRKDHGDLEELARSIAELGLLQPIGVTPDNRLVFGERRLKAVRDILGWETIPATIIDIDLMLHGQYAENEHRKDFTISERVAIVNALRSFSHGGDRRSDQVRNSENESLTLADATKKMDFGKDSFYRANEVTERGTPELVEAMDTGKLSINAAYELSKAAPEEQTEILNRRFDEGRATARAIRKQLCHIRNRKAYEDAEARRTLATENHERTEQTNGQPVQFPIKRVSVNSVTVGDCRDLISSLPDNSINLGLTSPPYAEQRKDMYPGVPEDEYPEFTVDWMAKLWDKLTDDGSVLIIIRPHLKDGVVSDYVLRTRLALREFGWKECEELIWYKPDGGNGSGSIHRPKRAFEHILWFSKTNKPFVDTKACGKLSDRLGFQGKNRFGLRPNLPYHTGQSSEMKTGKSRSADVIHVSVAKVTKGIMHPAMFPIPLAEHLIKTFCPVDGTLLDNFCGSGSTCLAAKALGRKFYGFDIKPEYVEIARKRLNGDDGDLFTTCA